MESTSFELEYFLWEIFEVCSHFLHSDRRIDFVIEFLEFLVVYMNWVMNIVPDEFYCLQKLRFKCYSYVDDVGFYGIF